ncbi:MAG: ACT domain-containing protein [Deferribacterota bacterium]|nr:ACT domain-containing protein [Deferribacterota bacterium]
MYKITQISVFLENEIGRLYKIIKILSDENINIRALSIADTSDFGILRLILDDPIKGFRVLKGFELTVGKTDVVAVEVPDRPGGLASVLKILKENELNVEYMYAFVERSKECAIMIFRFDELDESIRALIKNNIILVPAEKLYNL